MKLIIDIDEDTYKARQHWVANPKRMVDKVDIAIVNGTPLDDVLDKIREEIESIDTRYYSSVYGMDMTECADDFKHEILLIIDKYRKGANE